MTNYKNMLLIKGTVNWTGNKKATFKMIPLTSDCPYIEAVFDPMNMALGIVGKYKKSNYEMVPSLSKEGDLVPKKRKVKDGEFPFCQEKRLVESWNEHEILTKDEILNFVNMFAANAETFDVESFFKKALEDQAKLAEAHMKNTVGPENTPKVEMRTTVTEKPEQLAN